MTGRLVRRYLVGPDPEHVALSPDGTRAYLSNESANTVTILDLRSGRVIATLPVHRVLNSLTILAPGATPVGVAVSPDGSRVYVANGHANGISVVDAQSFRITGTIAVGLRPWGIAVAADDSTLYTANGLSNDVSVVDTRLGRTITTVKVGQAPWGVAAWPRSADPRR